MNTKTEDRPWIKPMSKGRRMMRISTLSVAKLMACLLEHPSTVEELISASGLNQQTVRNYMIALQREGAAHVSSWDMDGRGAYTRKVWALGHGRDAKRPAPKDRNQVEKAYRNRKRMAMQLGLLHAQAANDAQQHEEAAA